MSYSLPMSEILKRHKGPRENDSLKIAGGEIVVGDKVLRKGIEFTILKIYRNRVEIKRPDGKYSFVVDSNVLEKK